MANKKGTAMMMVMADIPADKEDDFNRWYNGEHLAELLSVPGILSAARYEAVSSGPKHLAFYELESPEVINTDAFKDRPRTEWGQRVSPSLIGANFMNYVFEMIHPTELTSEIAGAGMAPTLQIGRMDIPRNMRTNGTSGTAASTCLTTRRCLAASGDGAGGPCAASTSTPWSTSWPTTRYRRALSGWSRGTSTPAPLVSGPS